MSKKSSLLVMAAAALACLLATPVPGCGQGNTWTGLSLAQMVDAARWKLGPLRLNGAFQITNAGYDSDIYYGQLPQATPDYMGSAGVPVQVLLPLSRKVVLDLFDNPYYLFYLDNQSERGWNNVFQGKVHIATEKFYVQVGGGASNIRQRLSPELNINFRQKETKFNGLVLWQVMREMSLAILYGQTSYDYGDAEYGGTSIAEILNRQENRLDLVTYIQPSSRIRIFLNGQHGTYAFTEAASIFKDTRSYGLYGGLDIIPTKGEARPVEGVEGRIMFGYKSFDLIDPGPVDGSDFVGAVNLSSGLFRKTTGRVFFFKDFQFSTFSTATFFTSTSYGGGIRRLLSRRASVSYDLSFDRISYPEGLDDIPWGGQNRYATHAIALDVRIAQHVQITLLGTFGKRTMAETDQATNRNFIGLNLVYGVSRGTMSTPVSGLSR